MKRKARAFTLVEILIVVVILGILAAMVVPQFVNATVEAEQKSAYHEVQKLRRAIEVYQVRNANVLPDIEEGDRTWGSLVLDAGEYLKDAPVNPYVGDNKGIIVFGNAPDGAYHTDYGWIYNPATGEVWAASFDANDTPYPKP
jgi:general secretion pathway protein G